MTEMPDEIPDLYDALGLTESATQEEIRIAYRRLAKKYHPDASRDSADSSQFEKISSAYRILSDPILRGQYDEQRNGFNEEYDYEQDGESVGGGDEIPEGSFADSRLNFSQHWSRIQAFIKACFWKSISSILWAVFFLAFVKLIALATLAPEFWRPGYEHRPAWSTWLVVAMWIVLPQLSGVGGIWVRMFILAVSLVIPYFSFPLGNNLFLLSISIPIFFMGVANQMEERRENTTCARCEAPWAVEVEKVDRYVLSTTPYETSYRTSSGLEKHGNGRPSRRVSRYFRHRCKYHTHNVCVRCSHRHTVESFGEENEHLSSYTVYE